MEDLRDITESFLRVLAEASVEEADIVLRNYAFERITFRRTGKERNWESMLFDPMKGLKKFKLDTKLCRRNFQAFLFRSKQQKRNENKKAKVRAVGKVGGTVAGAGCRVAK